MAPDELFIANSDHYPQFMISYYVTAHSKHWETVHLLFTRGRIPNKKNASSSPKLSLSRQSRAMTNEIAAVKDYFTCDRTIGEKYMGKDQRRRTKQETG